MEIDKEHIHILIKISHRYAIGQHVRRIKQQSNKLLWNRFPQLKRQFWQENTFWSEGYFSCSVGNASAETIRKYIQEQG